MHAVGYSQRRATAAGVTRTAVIVVGDVLAAEGFSDSYLYSSGRARRGAALMRILLLGGTAEARALAARLHPDVDVISSLAGRVPDPALPVGQVRIGGFGGVDGMRRWLVDAKVDAVVDATHPYAATITGHAAAVCGELRLPHVVLARPAWPPGDAIVVGSDAEAAKTVVAERLFAGVFDHRTIRHGGLRRRRRVVSDPCGHRPRRATPCLAATNWCCRAGRTTTTTSANSCANTASTRW